VKLNVTEHDPGNGDVELRRRDHGGPEPVAIERGGDVDVVDRDR
jgi:hypothetical protein